MLSRVKTRTRDLLEFSNEMTYKKLPIRILGECYSTSRLSDMEKLRAELTNALRLSFLQSQCSESEPRRTVEFPHLGKTHNEGNIVKNE